MASAAAIRVGRRNCAPSVRTLPLPRTINSGFQLGPITACTGFAHPIVTDRGHRDRREENLRRAVGEMCDRSASTDCRARCRPAAKRSGRAGRQRP